MFNSLTGTVTGKFPQKLFLENNGIEWDITVPDSSLEKITSVGQSARVWTYLQHTDTLMNLFGFSSEEERSLFFELLKVDGIGPKGAVKIMSNIGSVELNTILENEDLGALEKVPGVGKKTAAKMLLQLKGKLKIEENSVPNSAGKNLKFADVVEGLVSMGHDRKKAEDCIARLEKEKLGDSGFDKLSQTEKENLLFRQALVEMAT